MPDVKLFQSERPVTCPDVSAAVGEQAAKNSVTALTQSGQSASHCKPSTAVGAKPQLPHAPVALTAVVSAAVALAQVASLGTTAPVDPLAARKVGGVTDMSTTGRHAASSSAEATVGAVPVATTP